MREQSSVQLKILSATLRPQDLQARLGLAPDESWSAGDRRGPFAAVEKHHGFVLESDQPPQALLEEHIKTLIRRIAPYAERIGALGAEASVEMICALHRKTGPAVRFERDDLRWLAVMGARLQMDVFILKD